MALAELPQTPAMEAVIQEVDQFILRAVQGKAKLDDALAMALRTEEYLRVFKTRAVVHTTTHVPRVIEAMAEAATDAKDVAAARLLFDVVGLTGHASGKGPTVLTQVNVTTPKLRDIIDIEAEAETGD